MNGFALLIGACKIVPPSPKAALILLMWFYGIEPGRPYNDYKEAYIEAGGAAQIKQIEQCFLDWTP